MKAALRAGDVERFRDWVSDRLGFQLDDSKLGDLAGVLKKRMAAVGTNDFDVYARRWVDAPRDEVRALAELVTVGETYFFRYADHFRAFSGVVLPDRLTVRTDRRIRVLSAGCSSGDEAYSIAIAIRERFAAPPPDATIVGVDVNPSAIEMAQKGRYADWSLRSTPGDVRARYFRAEGRAVVLDPAIRAMVAFEERNLVEDDPRLLVDGAFDVVFCRNVLMYLRPEVARAIIGRVHRALSPGGYLFLGHAETLRGISEDFELCHSHRTFYYRRARDERSRSTPSSRSAVRPVVTEESAATVRGRDFEHALGLVRHERIRASLSASSLRASRPR